MKKEKMSAISEFRFEGKLQECIPFGNGHINDTYRLTFETEHGRRDKLAEKKNCGAGRRSEAGGVESCADAGWKELLQG